MSKSASLRLGDVRRALRLVGECRDLGYDPGRWAPHMFAGLCRLVGARAGNGGEVRLSGPGGPAAGTAYFDAGLEPQERALYLEFLSTHGLGKHPLADGFAPWREAGRQPGRVDARTRRQIVPDREWYASVCYNDYHRAIRIDHCLASPLQLGGDGSFNSIILHRSVGEADFSERQRRLLHLFHAELGRLIGSVLVRPGDPAGPGALPPRVREALGRLLEGESEKQVAAGMGLSVPTVHQYVTALYRHYRVSSRAELLARVLRRRTS